MGMLVVLVVVVVIVIRAMTPEERARVLSAAWQGIQRRRERWLRGRRESQPFYDALVARTPRPVALPALVALNVAVLAWMMFSGGFGDPDAALRWGGNFAPRTTNGEWWRLATALVVHGGVVHLVVNMIGLVPVALIVERLIGGVAFAAVYLACGLFAALISVSAAPVTANVGASGAVMGIYGVLFASSLWGLVHETSVAIPLVVFKRLAPAFSLFVLFNVINPSIPFAAEAAGLGAGFIFGAFLTRGVGERKPGHRLVGAMMAATIVFAVAYAVPLRGVSDVRPEIQKIIDLERRSTDAYRTALQLFRSDRVTSDKLARMIEDGVMAELSAAQSRLQSLERVPTEHQPLVAQAREYVTLRAESWRLRAESLRERQSDAGRSRAEADYRASLTRRGRADAAERSALEALQSLSGF